MEQANQHRKIRSFVIRASRMTLGQKKAYEQYWPQFGLDIGEGQIEPTQLFASPGPLVFEIGFGMGQSLVQMAKTAPGTNFIGVEVHRPGVGKLLQLMVADKLSNIRIYEHDAVEVLLNCIPDNTLDAVHIFFPDPWHKARHHKRRLIQGEFVRLVHQRLKPQGILHLATDWEHYAQQMMAVLQAVNGFSNLAGSGQFSPRPESRPQTKFERRGEYLGHGVWDILFQKTA